MVSAVFHKTDCAFVRSKLNIYRLFPCSRTAHEIRKALPLQTAPQYPGQNRIERRLQLFGRHFFCGTHIAAEHFRMHAGIRPAAANDIFPNTENPLDGVLQRALHRHGVFLHLPAVIAGARQNTRLVKGFSFQITAVK